MSHMHPSSFKVEKVEGVIFGSIYSRNPYFFLSREY